MIDAKFAIKGSSWHFSLNLGGRSGEIFTRGWRFDIQPLVSQQPPPAIFISNQLRANATPARVIFRICWLGRLTEICMPHVCRLHQSIISTAENMDGCVFILLREMLRTEEYIMYDDIQRSEDSIMHVWMVVQSVGAISQTVFKNN